jgi:hypothetical protein
MLRHAAYVSRRESQTGVARREVREAEWETDRERDRNGVVASAAAKHTHG